MGMLRICATAGCTTKTLGKHCVEHETPIGPLPLRAGWRDEAPVSSLAVSSLAVSSLAVAVAGEPAAASA